VKGGDRKEVAMPERPRLWGRVGSALRWWPEYLVLVLLFVAVQIPVGVIALDRPLMFPAATVEWSSQSDQHSGPPPEAGWPAEVAARTKGWPSPTSISINSTWLRRTNDYSAWGDGGLKHDIYSAGVDAWGWPWTAVSRATIGLWPGVAYPRGGAGDVDTVADLHWGGLAINAFVAASLVALVCVLVVSVVQLERRRVPAEGGHRSGAPRSRLSRLLFEAAILALVGSIASSVIATTSVNRSARPWITVQPTPKWLVAIHGAMHTGAWPVAADARLKFPERPTNISVESNWGGFGITIGGTAQSPNGEFRSIARRYGVPFSTFVGGEWWVRSAVATAPAQTPPPPFKSGAADSGIDPSDLEPRTVEWSGSVVYDEVQSGRVPLRAAWSGLLLNPIFAVIVLWPVVFGLPRLWVWWVVRRRRLSGHCVTCNYDCVGLERCPECGRVLAE
jgi:hypothetical protein